MAKIKRIEPEIKRDVKQPRRLNIFQRGLKGITNFFRPVKPDLTIATSDPDEPENETTDPVNGNENTSTSGGENTANTDPGNNQTNNIIDDDMEPFIGEIRMFAGNFAPRGWAFCDGQTLDISSHQALFSLIGTFYGGDGRTNFKLPDLRSRVPIHMGQGQGLTNHPIGNMGGNETVTLSETHLPAHSHMVSYSQDAADSPNPENNYLATCDHNHYSAGNPGGNMNTNMLHKTGGGHAHQNMQPFLTINFIIALEGLMPIRS